ncbi:MAG: hypothetical protein GDA43_18905 [Hormoscilla sp. SP5CHS1]|nr:hypothetical protein [Hormoscilla sp. SP5CHS1]
MNSGFNLNFKWDVLTGGPGADVFVLESGNGYAIKDFAAGTDSIKLEGGLTFTDLRIRRDGNVMIEVESSGEILASLEGHSSRLISNSDFI